MRRLDVTAIHEAGHVYAARLRGATVTSVTLAPGLTTFEFPRKRIALFHNGIRTAEPQPQRLTDAEAFVYFAGPWAEAQALFKAAGNQPFSEHLAAATQKNRTDAQAYAGHTELDAWAVELGNHWREILKLAQRLLTAHHAATARSH